MELGLAKEIIETTIIIEILLILLIILFTYFAKLAIYWREKRKQKLTAEIENHFQQLLNSKQPLSSKKFPRRWKKIQILFPTFVKFDQANKNNPAWDNLRKEILQTILLPLARKRAYSRRWIIRFFACETLGMAAEKSDEKIITRLVKDRIPLIYMHAITAAVKSGSETAIATVTARMSKMSWLTQSMYLEPFKQASGDVRQIVEKQLTSSTDPNIRAQCYKILKNFPPVKPTWDINKDLQAKEFELRLSALKYLAHVDSEAAIPILQQKLKDEHWEVRLVAVHRLGRMKVQNAMTQLADCLNDPEWWVKISAAQALKGMGAEGEKLLKERAPELESIPFDATNHVSNSLW